jgi:hypothetical protein
MHPFFIEIKKYPELEKSCRTDLIKLPSGFLGKEKIKAILLGADPTNEGLKKGDHLIKLDTVFGIDSNFESAFFTPQNVNLKAIGLNKDNLFIQNMCRNYFTDQTSKNHNWGKIAKIWLPFLVEELSVFDSKTPLLVSAEKIMKVLIPDLPKADYIYNLNHKLPFFSQDLKRNVFPLYRQPTYYLSKNWPEYREYLKQAINE